MTDSELLNEVALKNKKAFDSLYRKYNKMLFRKCYARVKSITKAEEVMQNVWIDVWEHPERIKTDEEGNAEVMLANYLFFRILDMFRRESTDVIALVSDVSLEEVENGLSYTHVSEELDIKELEAIIVKILDELPGKQAEIFMMLHRDGYTVKEIANKLNMNERTVRAHSKQSLNVLKNEVEKEFSGAKKFKIMRDVSSSIIYIIFIADKMG
ncbi:MAG: RNA polymerase sigma factor [Fermentimonas sp.]|jgi:RNA polymerase sigma factor (sigma-70 family)